MPREIAARPVGRPADEPTPFARATKALAPETTAMLKGLWLSGKYPSKKDLAEAVGLDYDTLRHLAGREQWPTEAELRGEITDAATAAVRVFRNAELEGYVARTLQRAMKVERLLDEAIERFEKDGALIAIDQRTGESHMSKHRTKDLHDIVKMSRDHGEAVGKLLGLHNLDAKNAAPAVKANNSLIQINHLTKQK